MCLTPQQNDILAELINIGMGRAAATLNQMLGTHVSLQVPVLQIISQAELLAYFRQDEALSMVDMLFMGEFSGAALLVFPRDSAANLVDVLMGNNPQAGDLDMLRVGALTEVGNIILNGVVGSLSNMLKQRISYTIPTYQESNLCNVVERETTHDSIIIMARTQMKIEPHNIECQVILLFQLQILDSLIAMLDSLGRG